MDRDPPGYRGSQELPEGEHAREYALLALEPPRATHGPFDLDWVHVVGPVAGGLMAVGFAWVLRGGGGRACSAAAQGRVGTLRAQCDQA